MNTPPLGSDPSIRATFTPATRPGGTPSGDASIPIERYEMPAPDVNEQGTQLASLAMGLRAGDLEAHLMVPVETSQALARGGDMTWSVPEERMSELTNDTLTQLKDAGVEVKILEPEPPLKQIKHEKTLIIDDAIVATPNFSSNAERNIGQEYIVGGNNVTDSDWFLSS